MFRVFLTFEALPLKGRMRQEFTPAEVNKSLESWLVPGPQSVCLGHGHSRYRYRLS